MKRVLLPVTIVALIATSCGGEKNEKQETVEVKTEAEAVSNVPDTVNLVLGATDQMTYDKSEFKVKVGQTVSLTLKHKGTMPIESMGHNFVLLEMGTKVQDFAMEAQEARENEYIPESNAIIAHTKLIGGGDETTIVFDAPGVGIYDFICTFPGHYGKMKGVLRVSR